MTAASKPGGRGEVGSVLGGGRTAVIGGTDVDIDDDDRVMVIGGQDTPRWRLRVAFDGMIEGGGGDRGGE